MHGPHLRLEEILRKHTEWIAVHEDGRTFPLRDHEMEIIEGPAGTNFGFLDRSGYTFASIASAEISGRKLVLTLTRLFGAERFRVELIPRATLEELGENIEIARLEVANRLAASLTAAFPGSKIKRVFLNNANGRLAQIILESGPQGEEGIISDVSGTVPAERLITAAVLWLEKINDSPKNRIRKIRLLVGKGKVAPVRRLHACLNARVSGKIGILSVKPSEAVEVEEKDRLAIHEVKPLVLQDLWRFKPSPVKASGQARESELADAIEALDPDKIDRVYARNGITLRFRGLPFARFRRIKGREDAWFGTESRRRLLDDGSKEDLAALLDRLSEYRSYDSPNKQHLYYQASPEAWLESVLRKNVRKLDPNLVLFPIHNQFRTARDRIDLLALRRDGRLVIIELKVARDNGMVFQAVDYWRRIELQRRKGVLTSAKLFGNREIADAPALVYLAAPSLCFTKQTDVLIGSVTDEIEILQFELSEEWKRELKVLKIS